MHPAHNASGELGRDFRASIWRAVVASALWSAAGTATADIAFAGLRFAEDAFADTLQAPADPAGFELLGNATTLASAVTGSDDTTSAFNATDGTFFQVGFVDNRVVNGPGNDLAVYELNRLEDAVVTISGVTRRTPMRRSGFDSRIPAAGGGFFPMNVALFDLDDFGIGPGERVGSVRVQVNCTAGASADFGCTEGAFVTGAYVAIGALNSAPAESGEALEVMVPASATGGFGDRNEGFTDMVPALAVDSPACVELRASGLISLGGAAPPQTPPEGNAPLRVGDLTSSGNIYLPLEESDFDAGRLTLPRPLDDRLLAGGALFGAFVPRALVARPEFVPRDEDLVNFGIDAAALRLVGAGPLRWRVGGPGTLYLGINDTRASNNTGSFVVRARRVGVPEACDVDRVTSAIVPLLVDVLDD